jgi:8-oxo-dGTP pyrophosphatase MutT (NUDIX family)
MTSLKQVGALPLRKTANGTLEILLVSSRDTGRWIIPKGWTSKRMADSAAAAREAKEEAGVVGNISPASYGSYRYRKVGRTSIRMIEVAVYLLRVKKEKKHWQEQGQRRREWFDVEAASKKVREPRLKLLIVGLSNSRVSDHFRKSSSA